MLSLDSLSEGGGGGGVWSGRWVGGGGGGGGGGGEARIELERLPLRSGECGATVTDKRWRGKRKEQSRGEVVTTRGSQYMQIKE